MGKYAAQRLLGFGRSAVSGAVLPTIPRIWAIHTFMVKAATRTCMAQQTTATDRTADELTAGDEARVVYESVYAGAGNEQTVTLTVTDADSRTAVYAEADDGTEYRLDLDGGLAVEIAKADSHGNHRRVGHPIEVERLATDGGQQKNDPELAAATVQEAEDSLQVHMTRDEMREACRAWDLDGYSGPKGDMAAAMMEQAPEKAVGALLEEGVDIQGDLAEMVGLVQEDDEVDPEDEAADEDENPTPPGSLAGDLLGRDPEDYGYTAKLQMTEKQTAAVVAALEDPDATQAEVAEAADVTERYANSTLNRWRGTEDEVEAAEEAGASVPDEYTEVMA